MFAAVTPSPDAVRHLDDFLEPRREAEDLRWTSTEQWHVTLAFLAGVPDRSLDDLFARLARAAARRTPMRVRLAAGGAFPDPDRARVLWAGLENDRPEELGRLATGARAAAARAGVEVDGQRFHPHLTLARLGQPGSATRWVRLLDGYAGPEFVVDELCLVASYLGEGPRGRPRYETLAAFPLGG